MTDQNTFMETVKSVAEIVRTSEIPMPEDEILAYFSDMELNDNQKRMIMEYIMNPENHEENQEETAQNVSDQEEPEEEESNSKVFQMYLEELSMLPTYSQADRRKLYEKLVQGDTDVIETILAAWLKKVLTIAEKYIETKLNVEDLVQEGNMALFMKLQELSGSEPKEDMESVLAAAVEEGIVSYVSMIRGEQEQENTLVGKLSLVHEAKKMLALEKGQEPTIEELAEYTRMSVEELTDLEEVTKEL